MFLVIFLMLTVFSTLSVPRAEAGISLKAWLWMLPGNKLYVRRDAYIGYDKVQYGVTLSTRMIAVSNEVDSWDAIPAKSSWTVTAMISTGTLQSGTSTFAARYFTLSPVPRDLGVSFDLIYATNVVYANVTLSGIDSTGQFREEVVVSTNGSITYSNFAWNTCTVAVGPISFPASSTDIQEGKTTHGTNLPFNVGYGDKIGLSKEICQSTDVYKCSVRTNTTWADETTDFTISADYNTWTLSDVPDAADDYLIYFWGNLIPSYVPYR